MGWACGARWSQTPKRFEHPDRREAKRRDPPVEGGGQSIRRWHGIGDNDLQSASGEGEAKGQAHHAAAADHDIIGFCHGLASHAALRPSMPVI